jgi:uncharacterized protein (DUF2235 family)
MPRQLVVCCDGTWNEPDELRNGVAAPTNVAKLALGLLAGAASEQELFYEAGVGTTADERVLGGAFGYGLSRNVRNCYRFLAETYEQGDELYLFGFSRGAYTARSLAGLVRNCGILQKKHVEKVDQAFAFYRDHSDRTHPRALAAEIFRKMYSHPDDDIHFIGVWDTVGALGIPAGLPGWKELATRFWGFHDTQLSSHVRFAYHALAIDEQRHAFQPTLWTLDAPAAGQTVEQVWFAGVHSEIGGGSADPALSDIALLWMVEKAKACGLRFTPGQLERGAPDGVGGVIAPNYAAKIVDSRRGVWTVLRPYHRLREVSVAAGAGQLIASSAERRFKEHVGGYSPPGLREYLGAVRTTPVEES